MIKNKIRTVVVLVVTAILLIPQECPAPLTATVRPGYVYGAGERPTTSTLNRLGLPSVEVTGTVDGTAGITAGTVTGTLLSDSVVDNRTVEFTNASPRKIQVKASGIDIWEIAPNIAGSGLRGGGGTNLSVAVDGTFIAITNDVLTIGLAAFTNLINIISSNAAQNVVTSYTATNAFTSGEYTLVNGEVALTNHPWGNTNGIVPTFVRWVLVCKTNEHGYIAGDEFGVDTSEHDGSSTTFAGGGNATNLFLAVGSVSNIRGRHRTTGSAVTLNPVRWTAKVYARP
jgi:hypothetical protein